MEKTEFIKQLKRLIKKYHPDLRKDTESDTAANETAVKLINALNALKADKTRADNSDGKKKGDGYDFYKQGIQYYRNIHPGKFYDRKTDGTYVAKKHEEIETAQREIFLSFDRAESCFDRVIEKYPYSPWVEDSEQKLTLLKKLRPRYAHINLQSGSIIDAKQFTAEMGLQMF